MTNYRDLASPPPSKASLTAQARATAIQRVLEEHHEDYERYHRQERELRGLSPEILSLTSLRAEIERLRRLLAETGVTTT